MPQKRYRLLEIIAKLREAEVLLSEGIPIRTSVRQERSFDELLRQV